MDRTDQDTNPLLESHRAAAVYQQGHWPLAAASYRQLQLAETINARLFHPRCS